MKPVKGMNLEELATFVSDHLRREGIEVVLVGGACVSLYTNNQYQTLDLDFVERYYTRRAVLKAALAKIGFTESKRYFTHPDTAFFLEFPKAPITVGNEPVRKFETRSNALGSLLLLTATDLCKDRLAAFFYWNDRQCLQQAINIARDQQVDMADIARWAEQEGESAKFKSFVDAIPPTNPH